MFFKAIQKCIQQPKEKYKKKYNDMKADHRTALWDINE